MYLFILVKTAARRRIRSPYPRDILMGSSPTATAVIESRWPCRNTWQPFWEEGTDRELGTKDVDLLICSALEAPNLSSYVNTLNQSHSDIPDQPVDCACVLSTCIYVWSKAIKMNILIIIYRGFFLFVQKHLILHSSILWTNILFFMFRCWEKRKKPKKAEIRRKYECAPSTLCAWNL